MTMMKQMIHVMSRMMVMMMMIMMIWSSGSIAVTASSSSTTTTTTNNNKNIRMISQQPSISNVIRDLQKYPHYDGVRCVCGLITSRSVTAQQRTHIMRDILHIESSSSSNDNDEDESPKSSDQAIATSNGMILIQPSNVMEAVQLVSSFSSSSSENRIPTRIIYYPDPIDIQRGEGLMDVLGPVLESIVQPTHSSSSKMMVQVVIPTGMEASFVQTQIEQAIQTVFPYFIIGNDDNNKKKNAAGNIRELVFSKLIYTSSPQSILDGLLRSNSDESDLDGLLRQMSGRTMSSSSSSIPPSTFVIPQQLAASNQLRPVAQEQYHTILSALQRTCFSAAAADTEPPLSKSDLKFVPNFGELCDAIVTKEMAFWYDTTTTTDSSTATNMDMSLRKSVMGRHICEKVYEDVFMYIFTNIYSEQIQKLQKICYDTLKKDLSKLVISPNLATDMNRIGQASIATFITDTVRLLPKTSFAMSSSSQYYTSYLTSYAVSAQRMYVRKVLEYIQNRILLAKASGKFRPVPRKGITIGMHYLLPKPFGNDYRQEPSMIHATDHMVYVPPVSKLSDVAAEQVVNGDWKNSMVPHPPGNDMLYMQ